jgi:hypothetical protein
MPNAYDLDLQKVVDWKKISSKDLFFEPMTEPVVFNKKPLPHRNFIFRLDETGNKKLISMMSSKYQLIPNRSIHDTVTHYKGLRFTLDSSRSTNKNDKFFQMVYDVNAMELQHEDDHLKPKLILKSSYDGSKPLTAMFGFFRMICANLIVIPISKSTVYSFSEKHYNNFEYEEEIENFIKATFNEEVFNETRDKIELFKENNAVDVDFSFFNNLPTKELLLYIGMIQKYCKKVLVNVNDGSDSFNLKKQEHVKGMVDRIIKNHHRNEEFVTSGLFDKWLEQVDLLTYPEEISNQWDVFNMMVKISHAMVSKEKRLKRVQTISEYFLQ